jgi:outer membrane protein, heavy metal efflux system
MNASALLQHAALSALAIALAGCQSSGPLDRSSAHDAARPTGAIRPEEPVAGPDTLPITLDETSTLADYLAYAALNSPALQASFHRWRAAVERIPQANSLPDPMLGYGYFLEDFTARRGMEQHVFELSQTFPWFGKLRLRGDVAAQAADAAAHEYEATRLNLFLGIRQAYYELYQLQRQAEVADENLALAKQIESVARARYRAGEAPHADLIRAQVELGRMEDSVREIAAMRRPAAARLNAALNRAPDAPVAWPAQITEERLGDDAADLLAALRERNPRLRAMQAEVELERIETDLARLDGYPDVTLGGMYALRGDDPLQARIAINLPLWRERYAAAAREANLRRLAAAYSQQDESNRLGFELQEALFAHDDAQRRLELYRSTLIPKARESLQASLTAFQAGASTYLDLLDSQRTLLEFELSESRARADRASALARLDALVGQPVLRLPDPESPRHAPATESQP